MKETDSAGYAGHADKSGEDFVRRIGEGTAFASAPAGTLEADRGMSCGAGRQSVIPGAGAGRKPSRGRRIAALALVILLVVAVGAASVVAHSRGVGLVELISGSAKAQQAKEIRGAFRFGTLDGSKETEFVHTDAYFDDPSSVYNPSLASMSCALALSAGGSQAEDEAASATATELLDKLGFEDLEVNESYDEEPTPDSIGVVAGRKALAGSGREMAVVLVRGGGYRAEWASNMDVGAEDEHEGFAAARDQVLRFVRSWEHEKGIRPEAFWVVGYSRGGAVAGLVARALEQEGTAAADAIYGYAFEPPASIKAEGKSAVAQAAQAPVWNIVNPADLVPRVPLAHWGFIRPGKDVTLPSVGEDGYAQAETAMRDQLAEVDANAAYNIAAFGPKTITAGGHIVDADDKQTQEQFLDSLTTWLAGKDNETHLVDASIPSSAAYAIEVQSGLMYFAKVFAETGPSAMAKVQERVTREVVDHPLTYATEGIAAVAGKDSYGTLAKAYAKAMDAEGVHYDRAKLEDAVAELARFLLAFAIDNTSGLTTLVGNVDLFLQAHSGPAVLAWVRAGDPNFAEDPLDFAR